MPSGKEEMFVRKDDGFTYAVNKDGTTSKIALASDLTASVVVQVVGVQTGASSTGTTAIPNDNSIPQKTEGDEVMTVAITPDSATNILLIQVIVFFSIATDSEVVGAALFQDATTAALAAGVGSDTKGDFPKGIAFNYSMTSGTTSETTFKVRLGGQGTTVTFNGSDGTRLYGGVMASSITITEILVV